MLTIDYRLPLLLDITGIKSNSLATDYCYRKWLKGKCINTTYLYTKYNKTIIVGISTLSIFLIRNKF